MPDAGKRIANWDEKYNLEQINAILTEKGPTMKTNMSVVFTSLAVMETQVKQTCDAAGAPTIQYPFYLCFHWARTVISTAPTSRSTGTSTSAAA